MKFIKVFKDDKIIEICNDKYPQVVTHIGDDRFPDINENYKYLQFFSLYPSECYWVNEKNQVQLFNEEQLINISSILDNWTQALGQAGNPTDAQKEEIRINKINKEAGKIITNKYSIVWQLNHPRMDDRYIEEYKWIDSIRDISNKAISNGLSLEDIDWGL